MLRDDVIEYSLDGHHSEEAGKKIRTKIWKVTALLTAITLVEVLLGVYIKQGSGLWPFVKWTFIALTLLKAAYIVLIFMHLGDEKKSLKYIVLVPYFLFMLYLIFIAFMEALAVGDAWATYGG
ncbi:MAG: cytochrome C oxidase subunit IV family protein [Crocinitomicaceae bacterium]|jgi:cytochrome c oxidase subunit IV|nr:cytochrome C oxidase subunit IV family protein [Crocinitomicaceae bacterium]